MLAKILTNCDDFADYHEIKNFQCRWRKMVIQTKNGQRCDIDCSL